MGRRIVDQNAGSTQQAFVRALMASRASGIGRRCAISMGRSLNAGSDMTVIGTRKFARRQESRFRKDVRIRWLPDHHPELVSAAYALAGPTGAGAVLTAGTCS